MHAYANKSNITLKNKYKEKEMEELKGSVESGHPLWEYINTIEKNMDDDSLLRAIGKRIGILVPESEPQAVIYLYFALKEIIETQKDYKKLSYLINVSYPEYVSKFVKFPNNQDAELFYWNRLLN